MTKEEFLDKSRNTHGYKYNYVDLPEKLTLKSYIKVEFRGIEYTQRVNKHLDGKCPEKNTERKTINDFIEKSREIWGDRFDYSHTEYKNALTPVKLFDKKRNLMIEQISSLHLLGHECKNMKLDDFISESNIIFDYKYKYEKTVYTNRTTRLTITCPEHGDFIVKPNEHLDSGLGCKKCVENLFTKKVKGFLNKHLINYSIQNRFNDCLNHEGYRIPFDFYIPSKRTIIEFDGKQHYEPVEHFGGLKAYESLKINDKIKNDYCEDNYINLIRIRYDQIDNIYQILWNNLKS